MKVKIKVSSEIENSKRSVFINDELSHHIDENRVQEILDETRLGSWKTQEQEGIKIGTDLFKLLNGSAAQLSKILNESYNKGESLHLLFDIPYDLDLLPLELLYNQNFLLLNSQTHIVRNVNNRNRLKKIQPEKRELKLLFMACSPIDLKDSMLEFEKEEENILINTEKYPVDMMVEDTGSLIGLSNFLYEADSVDVVHISGHAGVDPNHGPVFYMEDEFGKLDQVTPDMLWDALKDFTPKILFLSGCSTAKSDKVNVSESFAYRMVEKGVSYVIGWGLPVSDKGATLIAAELYKYLAMGKSIDEAVQRARQLIQQKNLYHPWPLLRLFTDGSNLAPIISAGQKIKSTNKRKTTYKFLQNSHVKVLEYGFVGRRRELQKGLSVLKGKDDKYGVIIRGPAGIGKSCLVGKLVERLKDDKELVVFHGQLNKADILQKIRHLLDRKGFNKALELLKSDIEYEYKIKELFRNTFIELPTVIYFDDFEQNLCQDKDHFYIKPEVLEVIKPFLHSFNWSKGKTNLLITSRYPFVLEIEGKNIAEEYLADITLMSFKGSDLEKKTNELPNISKSINKYLYLEFGKGNPRLLEWIERIAENEDEYQIDELRTQLQDKDEDYINEYLAEIIARAESEDFLTFLRKSSVYRQPVNKSAFESFGSINDLEKGVDLTLFEKESLQDGHSRYWVSPIIRDKEFNKISSDQKIKIHEIAFKWYDQYLSKMKSPDYQLVFEAKYHSYYSNNFLGASKYAVIFGNNLTNLLLYKDSVNLLQKIADNLTDEVIIKAINKKDDNVTSLFNNIGLAWNSLGDSKKALEFFNKALDIDLEIFGDKHPNVSTTYNNIGLAWNNLGDSKKAIEFYNKALDIDLEIFGDKHQKI
ncbi:MAG: CHAT domain-containing protein [Candidatus Dadabacteria bacterium]|nr:CHAT domain-containing protein [Candidatus Dadabacteria bacterium]